MVVRSARIAAAVAVVLGAVAAGPRSEDVGYYVYVASESADQVSLLKFTPGAGMAVERVIPVGFWPAEMEGPHGIAVDPEAEHWYLTLGHGFPFGSLLKYRAGADTLVGRVELGLFPATVAVTNQELALIVNSNFHGEHQPSTVSVVDVGLMLEVARIETCTMPHGSRLGPDHGRHYSACMLDDQLVEIDLSALEVSRRLDLPAAGRTSNRPRDAAAPCSPTWAAPSPDGRFVYVPCNQRDEILEVDLKGWRIARRWAAPKAPYNAEVTPEGDRLVVTQKGSGEVSVWNLASGQRVALIPSTRKVTHGVTVSPDGRYAFVSVEGIGGEPGAVDVIDLERLEKVATADVGRQAGGIIFWKIETD